MNEVVKHLLGYLTTEQLADAVYLARKGEGDVQFSEEEAWGVLTDYCPQRIYAIEEETLSIEISVEGDKRRKADEAERQQELTDFHMDRADEDELNRQMDESPDGE